MQNTTTTGPVIAFSAAMLSQLSLTEKQAEALFVAAVKRDHLRSQVAALEEEYRRNLPFANDGQMDVYLEALRNETEVPEGNRPNVDFVLSDAQQAHAELVKAERKEWCARQKAAVLENLRTDGSEVLTSFKVRAGKKRTTTTLRFERTHEVAKTGLIAKLQAAARIVQE